MVLTTLVRAARIPAGHPRGPDRIWKRRKILRMSAHFYGRKRNCYRIAIKYVEKAWQYLTQGRKVKKEVMAKLWVDRVSAACEEHGTNMDTLKNSLLRLDVLLNRKVLADLAIWEPRTFKSLANLSRHVAVEEGMNTLNSPEPLPPGVYTRSMLRSRDDAHQDGLNVINSVTSNPPGVVTRVMLNNKDDSK